MQVATALVAVAPELTVSHLNVDTAAALSFPAEETSCTTCRVLPFPNSHRTAAKATSRIAELPPGHEAFENIILAGAYLTAAGAACR
jgi:hypothetical protein